MAGLAAEDKAMVAAALKDRGFKVLAQCPSPPRAISAPGKGKRGKASEREALARRLERGLLG